MTITCGGLPSHDGQAVLTVVSYLWGAKYSQGYLDKLATGVRRNLKQPYRFAVITDDLGKASIGACYGKTVDEVWFIPDADRYLLDRPGCLVRLRLFDPEWQQEHGIKAGERIVCIDLDAIVTGPLDPLFDRDESFVILQNINTANPCPYNGSIWMLRAGEHAEVWREFSLEAIERLEFFAFPDDQGWMDHLIPNAGAWGPATGVYGFGKSGWPAGSGLPSNARLVAFPGWRDPSKFAQLSWVQEHWHA